MVPIPPLSMVDDILTVTDAGVKAIKMNAAVQSKIDVKKLELGKTKCFQMNIGAKNDVINPTLKIHDEEMSKSNREKYLGDILTSDCKIDETVRGRQTKGIGIVNQIMSILKEISFGPYFFEMAFLLRSSMLLNGMLFSSEALIGMTEKHILMLEDCDLMLMRKIFQAQVGTPKESFYLESAVLPIRFVIIGRRLMFLWSILHKDDSELVKKVYKAQKMFPQKGNWASVVKDDLEFCDIKLTDEEIQNTKKNKFKGIVKKSIRVKSNNFLLDLQAIHSKSKHLEISDDIPDYLTSEELSLSEKKLLFKLRSRMVEIKENYKGKYKENLLCSFCGIKDETAVHLLECKVLLNDLNLDEHLKNTKVDDIFKDVSKQAKSVRVWRKILDKMSDELNKEKS